MRLRIRDKDRVHIITTLNEESKTIELRREIQRINGVSPAYQELKIGFPPKICDPNDEVTLKSAGIQNGDLIHLTDLTPPKPAITTATTTTNKKSISSKTNTSAVANTLNDYFTEQTDDSTKKKNGVISSPVENGYAILREMTDDNSCLFRAIGYVLENSSEAVQKLRKIVIDTVNKDPETYSDIILGRSRQEYCKWIAQKNSWGGAIELAIFSSHYKVEIRSMDVGTGRIDKYGEGNYDNCVYIIYSGIHYDAFALTPMIDASKDYDQTVFENSDQSILSGAISIANKMKKLHKYTYTANFTLKCGQCGKGLTGDKEALQHAQDTGHKNFAEYN